MTERKCCYLEDNVTRCGADAEWELWRIYILDIRTTRVLIGRA